MPNCKSHHEPETDVSDISPTWASQGTYHTAYFVDTDNNAFVTHRRKQTQADPPSHRDATHIMSSFIVELGDVVPCISVVVFDPVHPFWPHALC